MLSIYNNKHPMHPPTWKNVLSYTLDSRLYEPTRAVRNYIHLAYAMGYTSTVRKSKHCAIIFGDEIAAVGINRSLPNINIKIKSIHAEVDALNELTHSNGTTLLVIKVRKLGGFKNSRPCLECLQTIKARGIAKLIWSGNNGEFYYVNL
jgi:hypothetical protein